jgi:hypothetical protein
MITDSTRSYAVGLTERGKVALAAGVGRHLAVRAQRGRNLLSLGYKIVGAVATPGTYFVTSPQGNFYMVELSATVARCNCPDFKKNGMPCKHLAGVMFHQSEIDAETEATRATLANVHEYQMREAA